MEKKQVVAIGIALQTQVLKTCPVHNQLYFDEEANPASAFALAIELIRRHKPYVEEFQDAHELTDMLSYTLGITLPYCPDCQPPGPSAEPPNSEAGNASVRGLNRGTRAFA